jgi:hypothetical protein
MRRSIVLALLLGSLAAPVQAREGSRNEYYGAIAYHGESGSSGFAVDRKTSREARIEALRQCGEPKCEVVARLRANCGAVAKRAAKFAIERGATRQEAETKALRRCGEACEIAVWACTR